MTVYKLLTHLKVNTPSQAAGIESDIFIFAALACGKNTKVVFLFFFFPNMITVREVVQMCIIAF